MARTVVLFASVALSLGLTGCGSSRSLTAISVTPDAASGVAKGTAVTFTATGTFSESPTTVSPLAVNWSFTGVSAMPVPSGVSVTSQGLAECQGFVGTVNVVAIHPVDPNAPPPATVAPGNGVGLVVGRGTLTCK